MHEDDRKFWAEQARKEREASQGRTYTPAAPAKPRTGRQPRKKTSTGSNVRYCPMAARSPDPVDERMDDIVKLIIAGKTGDEIGGELQKKKPSVSVGQPVAEISIEASSLPLLAPVPRSARASVSLDALELQSHLSRAQLEQESTGTSLSPNNSLLDLPATPEHSLMSGYHTPYDVQHSYLGTLNPSVDQSLRQNRTPDFSFNAPSLSDRSGSIDAEPWSLAETPDASSAFQHHPIPPSHKEYPEPSQFGYPQGWGYYSAPTPVYTLNYPPASFDTSGHSNYTSHSLVPSASSWRGPDSVSAYDVPGHAQTTHTGDLAWPSEWVNDSY
ncbi:hypothetical protein BDV93DRAFT_143469 [Ceratobasidium sp. AG-I]|nr:hypothetical protein BDV93DRAFT_143469 [Ceratobasidium sp. AG-I]